jgi:hypothetical protein
VGNHEDGWNVVTLDGSVQFLRAGDLREGDPAHGGGQTIGAWLSNDVKHKGAFLAVLKQPPPDPPAEE